MSFLHRADDETHDGEDDHVVAGVDEPQLERPAFVHVVDGKRGSNPADADHQTIAQAGCHSGAAAQEASEG